eukprot:351943-Chlamydomonas_euryale.AAC.6
MCAVAALLSHALWQPRDAERAHRQSKHLRIGCLHGGLVDVPQIPQLLQAMRELPHEWQAGVAHHHLQRHCVGCECAGGFLSGCVRVDDLLSVGTQAPCRAAARHLWPPPDGHPRRDLKW